jgi:prolipoprotein diacylglyceryltransferase
MGMLTYPITRFAIEYLRGDEMGQFGTGFTISQIVSAGLFLGGVVFTIWLDRSGEPSRASGRVLPKDGEEASGSHC